MKYINFFKNYHVLHGLSENFSRLQFGTQGQDNYTMQRTGHPRTGAGTIGFCCAEHNVLNIIQPIVQFISVSTFVL